MNSIKAACAVLAALGTALAGRALLQPSRQQQADPAPDISLDAEGIGERLGGALRIPTISHENPKDWDEKPFLELHAYLEKMYPSLHQTLTREIVSGYSLLYTWPGSEPSLDPAVLMAHQDVVPVDPAPADSWGQPAFSGNIADGCVWGRGALDNKENLAGIFEAVEHLISQGFQPRRTIILVCGHDEELGGTKGAVAVIRLLAERNIHPAFVIDEGGAMLEGTVPGVAAPVAVVGVAEKGYVSVELTAQMDGGHSSTPSAEGAIGVLAEAVRKIENSPFPARLEPPVDSLFETVAPEAGLGYRLVFSNLWLFKPLIMKLLESVPETAALIRTTTAPTVFQAGGKDNVVPGHARAVVNFRTLPGDTIDDVAEHVRRTVADDRVRINVLPEKREVSNVSPTDCEEYELLARTIRETFPGTIVTPYIEVGGSDSRHFEELTRNVYRFMPFLLSRDDLKGIHGANERVSLDALAKAVNFYARLIRNASE